MIVMSARPGRIKAEIVVDLPHPRSYKIKTTPEFVPAPGATKLTVLSSGINSKLSARTVTGKGSYGSVETRFKSKAQSPVSAVLGEVHRGPVAEPAGDVLPVRGLNQVAW